jgi:polysaccharide pyruvyl transferase WcaK-like protein
MKLCLFSSINTNIGDDFIREGLVNLLRKSGIEFDSTIVNKHDSKSLLDDNDKNKILESDMTVICGTPVFWSINGSTSYNCDWINWFYEDFIFQSKTNYCIVASGSCNDIHCDIKYLSQNDHQLSNFINKLTAKALFVTTRDYICSNILTEFNVIHKNYFCTALHAIEKEKNNFNQKYIGLNLMNNFGHFSKFEMFQKKLDEIVKVIRNYGPIKFICHNSDELSIANELKIRDDLIFFYKDYQKYFNAFDDVLLHISCRVHGSILSSSSGTPNINIISDSRGYSCDRISAFIFDPWRQSYMDLDQMIKYIIANIKILSEDLKFLKDYNEVNYVNLLTKYFYNFS